MGTGSKNDKVALVTGASDGIGKATAMQLARSEAHVIIHGRDRAKLARVSQEIALQTGKRPDIVVADFMAIDEVERLAATVRAAYPNLNILINNAGMYSATLGYSSDGCEQTMAVNYLAPFVLTNRLFEMLAARGPSRIINVTSVLHKGARLDFHDLNDEQIPYDGIDRYAASKLALTMLTFDLANRSLKPWPTVNCVHPGGVATKLLRAGFGSSGLTPEQGAEPIAWLALAPELEQVSGKYFERTMTALPDRRTQDLALQKALRNSTEALLSHIHAEAMAS